MPLTNSRQFKTEKAFTLIELLVVIAIIGILAGLAVVNMSGATEAARIAKLKVYSNSIRSSLMGNRVSEWIFDEGIGGSAADTVGTNNGTLTNFTFDLTDGWRSGSSCVSGNCLLFDGANDHISVPSALGFGNGTGGFTVSLWAKIVSTHASNIIYSQGGSNHTGGIIYFNGTRKLGYYGIGNRITDIETADLDKWYHVVLVGNGGADGARNVTLYKNAVSVGTWVNNYDFPQTAIFVGTNQDSIPEAFNGFIDEVRVYNAAMTASAIRDQYVAGLDKLLASNQITEKDYQQRLTDLNSTYAIDKSAI
jgi:prepilin-type N-terminal cleavage/methylation domain-containing protein